MPDVSVHQGGARLLHCLRCLGCRMIRVEWIASMPMKATGLDMIQNHVTTQNHDRTCWIMIQNQIDLLTGKVEKVPTRSTATALDAAAIIRDLYLRSRTGFPDVPEVDHDAKFTSEVFRAFVKSMVSSLIAG